MPADGMRVARYAPRCTTITAFQRYCGGSILQRGGAGVLQPEMRAIVAPVLARAMQTRSIPRPDLRKGARAPAVPCPAAGARLPSACSRYLHVLTCLASSGMRHLPGGCGCASSQACSADCCCVVLQGRRSGTPWWKTWWWGWQASAMQCDMQGGSKACCVTFKICSR